MMVSAFRITEVILPSNKQKRGGGEGGRGTGETGVFERMRPFVMVGPFRSTYQK